MQTDSKTLLLEALKTKNLTSCITQTQWQELIDKIHTRLPFRPAFQEKLVLEHIPYPEQFDTDPTYECNWQELPDYIYIEWLRVKPRLVVHEGMRIPPRVIDSGEAFKSILNELHIAYEEVKHDIIIRGYK
ncbi:MAG: hypothetical protein KBD15_03490 [Candidatus Magasanikbacteria bacterium]|jgi:hypothetical protein|nr:hypothetical protein [Candidatus Magasanikbacteria bacterium]